MTRSEFNRQLFGDTETPTEIDYDWYRHEAARLRRAAMSDAMRRAARSVRKAAMWLAASLRPGAAANTGFCSAALTNMLKNAWWVGTP